MKLINAHVTEFRSINDSTQFEIGDITCLVGKNESGKTALLKALYKLNPIVEENGNFDVTDDYPRRDVSDYEDDVESGKRSPATVICAIYALEDDDILVVENAYGKACFTSKQPTVSLSKGYAKAESAQAMCDVLQSIEDEEQTESIQQLLKQLEPIAKNGLSYVVYDLLRP